MTFTKARTLSEGTLIGLSFIQRYRFLTIAQFARTANFSNYHAAEVLRDLERWGMLGFFGYVGIPGQGKTPKVYYLKRKGFDLLAAETDFLDDENETFSEVHKEATWTPAMYHRLRTVDLMISAECAVRNRPHLTMVKTLLEYKRIKKGHRLQRETSDYVAAEEISENRLVPDGAFILENTITKKRALFFVEMDMATERIMTRGFQEVRNTLRFKFTQYDRYLTSLRYATTYREYGEFRHFIMLFVTLQENRIENIRREMANLPVNLAGYHRLTTFDAAMGDFLGQIWMSRNPADTGKYALVQENTNG